MNGRFAHSIVLITGATSGIGEACANLFALEGASLMLTGRDEPRGNLNGSFFTARAALRQMLKQGSGNIVNIASDLGLVGGKQAVAYCASKGAVVMMTKAMALDHARDNIRINALCPTDTDTPMMHRDYANQGLGIAAGLKNSADANPMGRIAKPEDVAEAACFIASAAAGFITGVSLPVDGAATAD